MSEAKILVIDDESIVVRTMQNILEMDGYTVETAENGAQGVLKVKEGNFDIVFLDLKLPDKNGLDIMKEIKEIQAGVSVIMITGYATIESATAAIRLSAYDYIMKPIEPEQIRRAVRTALKRKKIESAVKSKIPECKVMIVESEAGSLGEIARMMLDFKMETVTIAGSKEAFEYLKKNSYLNCILYQAGDGQIDGVKFLQAAKGVNPEMVFIPITQKPDLNEAVLMMREGAFDYISEPVSTSEIFDIVRKAWQVQNLAFMNKQLVYDLQKINEQTSLNEGRFRAILRSIGDGVITTDMEGRVFMMNDAAEKITGLSAAEAEGKSIETVFKVMVDGNFFMDHPVKAMLNGDYPSFLSEDIVLVDKNGKQYNISLSIDNILTQDDSIIGLVLAFRDISYRKQIERKLVAKNQELSDFTRKVSHHLKSPLNNIRGYLNIIKDEPAFFDKYFDRNVEIIDSLIFFVNNLLNLARSGQAIGNKVKIDVKSVVNKIFSSLKKPEMSVELRIEPSFPIIYGDLLGVEQVLANLFQNSIKSRDEEKGNLIIKVSYKQEEKGVTVFVEDNGIGIEEEQVQKIFDSGYTLFLEQGTGFGLSINRKIMEAHGGCIKVISEGKGKGTRFSLFFPGEGNTDLVCGCSPDREIKK